MLSTFGLCIVFLAEMNAAWVYIDLFFAVEGPTTSWHITLLRLAAQTLMLLLGRSQ